VGGLCGQINNEWRAAQDCENGQNDGAFAAHWECTGF
jgi:hypothetical protein